MLKRRTLLAMMASLAAMASRCLSTPVKAAPTASPEEARKIAAEAYIYAYAPIASYGTWYKQTVDEAAPEYVGGFNRFRNYSEPFTAENHDIVTPNNDTPYSWAWLDLRAEPMVVGVPAVANKRYYVLQFIDHFTFNFAYVGSRATGNEAGNYLVAGPNWQGDVPDGIDDLFKSETEIVGILGRTALDGPDDVENVKAIQAGYKIQPLSAFAGTQTPPSAPSITFPPYDEKKAQSVDFIAYLNVILQFAEPPHPSEVTLRKRFAAIGIEPGIAWDKSTVDPALLTAIGAGIADAKAQMKAVLDKTLTSNGLFGSRAFLKDDYMTRAVAAAKGLFGNSLEEAWYGGYVGDGTKPSVIYFAPGQLPPAKFFWSMTLYTLPDRFLYANEINRYSIGDRTKGLQYGKDGSLTLYVDHNSPGEEREANWLPSPAGPYSLVARVYGPGHAMIDGAWLLPKLQPASATVD